MILSLVRSSPVVVCMLFLFVFGASVKVLPVNTSKLVIVFSLMLFCLMQLKPLIRGTLSVNYKLLWVLAIPFFLMCYAALSSVFRQTNDYYLPYNLFILTFENVLGSYIFSRVYFEKRSLSQVFDAFIWVGLIQCLVILLMMVNAPFRDFVFEWFSSAATVELNERYGGIRGFGIAGSVTYDLSVLLSIFMMLSAYQLCVSSRNQLFYVCAWLLGFVAVMVSGRTGFLGVFLSFVIMMFMIKKKNTWTGGGKLLFCSLFGAFFVIFTLSTLYPELFSTITDVLLPYAFEMFFNLSEGNGLNTNSSDVLASMYFPIAEKTFWLGDSYWRSADGNSYYMYTDAGYMRHVLFYGVVGSFLLYFYYFYIFGYIFISSLTLNKNLSILFLGVSAYAYVVHIKGDFLVGSSMNIKLIFIIFFFFVCVYKREYFLSKVLSK